MDAGGGGNPVLAPILFQQRPQYLIDILTVPANRASKDPLLDGPELPERGVAAPVLAQHARLETARANCAKGERLTSRAFPRRTLDQPLNRDFRILIVLVL